MPENPIITARKRNAAGSGAARRTRRSGWLPTVLNNAQGRATPLETDDHDFQMMLRRHRSATLLLELRIEGEEAPRRVLLREVQHDPLTGRPIHADFVEASMTRKMRVRIPIELTGEPTGVTHAGGVLDQPLRELEVETLPGDIVEFVTADVSAMQIGQTLLVSELALNPAWTILTDRQAAVATILAPRIEEEAAPAAGETAPAEETTEPEVISARKEKPEEEEKEEKAKGKVPPEKKTGEKKTGK